MNLHGMQDRLSSHRLLLCYTKEMLIPRILLGWAFERTFLSNGGGKGKLIVRPDNDNCVHHHTNKGNFVGKGSGMVRLDFNLILQAHISKVKESSGEAFPENHGSSNGDLEKSVDSNSPGRSWVWFPSTYDLKSHYVCIHSLNLSCWIGIRASLYVWRVITLWDVFRFKIPF